MSRESGPETTDAVAEEALFEVFQSLPLAAPSESFAARVLERAGVTSAQPTRWTRTWRTALAASLVLAGLAAAFLPEMVMRLVGPMVLIRPLEWAAAMFVGVVHQLATALDVWSNFVAVGHGVRLAFSTPPLFAAVVAGLVLSAIAVRVLYGLMVADRRRSHYVH